MIVLLEYIDLGQFVGKIWEGLYLCTLPYDSFTFNSNSIVIL